MNPRTRRLRLPIALMLLFGCSRNPKAGMEHTIASLGLAKPDGIICDPSGCMADTCVLRYGQQIQTWVCDSDSCCPRTPGDDVHRDTTVIYQPVPVPQ